MGARIERPDFTRTRGPCNFRQRDMTATVKALQAAGHVVSGVEVFPDGRFKVLIGGPATPASDLDAELRAFGARHAG